MVSEVCRGAGEAPFALESGLLSDYCRDMNRLFAPYTGDEPTPIVVNGHRLLIISSSKRFLDDGLGIIGGDRIKTLPRAYSSDEQERLLGQLAEKTSSGIVIAPNDVDMQDLIRSLESELPWVQ